MLESSNYSHDRHIIEIAHDDMGELKQIGSIISKTNAVAYSKSIVITWLAL